MKRRSRCVCALMAMLVINARAASITTTEIVQKTGDATFSCMQWTPVGLCFWVRCSVFGCDVETTLKVGHYNPDFVVSSYNELGENPWREVRSLLGQTQAAAASGVLGRLTELPVGGGGTRTEGTADHRDHKNLKFREADVLGHPLPQVSTSVPQPVCASQSKPFVPYFLSSLGAWSWRQAIPEILYPASITPGLREVGHWPLQTWGSVFPRTGWSIQAEEPKAAALTAQRAGDIVTRARQPHVYQPLKDPKPNDQRVWLPGPLREGDAGTGTWQMLSPRTDADCAVFGVNDLASGAGWGGGRVDAAGDYVWNLWRPYECCEREGQMFLLDINWTEFPE